ncbi:hypothetical protein CPB86DRAFT_88596 [Serendipita vermifera]|nr:hypothetical protein CPB86DRAFT_88596 [Serendipita vermifera]
MTAPAEREREIFTDESKGILVKSTDIAHGNKNPSVTPLHLFLVLLCGKDIDISRGDFASSSPPTLCWSAIEEQSIEPVRSNLLRYFVVPFMNCISAL